MLATWRGVALELVLGQKGLEALAVSRLTVWSLDQADFLLEVEQLWHWRLLCRLPDDGWLMQRRQFFHRLNDCFIGVCTVGVIIWLASLDRALLRTLLWLLAWTVSLSLMGVGLTSWADLSWHVCFPLHLGQIKLCRGICIHVNLCICLVGLPLLTLLAFLLRPGPASALVSFVDPLAELLHLLGQCHHSLTCFLAEFAVILDLNRLHEAWFVLLSRLESWQALTH